MLIFTHFFWEVLREKLEGGLKQSVEKIHRMYEDAIVPFENTDDEYKKKLGSYYDEWASVGDKFADGWHVVKNAGLGVWDGLTDLVLGILNLLKGVGEVVLWLALQNPVTSYFGIMPESLEEDMGELWIGIKQLLKDPGNIVEAIGQSTFDTVDEKGAAGDVAKYTDEVAEAASKAGKHADDVPKATKAAAGKAVSESGSGIRFKYEHNPMDNPKAARDIIENPDAVYGFSPNSESTRIGKYADKIDWTNSEQVVVARQTREAYHNINESMLQDLYNSGYTTKDIAAKMVEERNMNRINSYINNGDLEGLEIVKQSNLETYGNEFGMSLEQALEKYGSYEEIINATVRSNPGMDACTGLYDIYHGGK